MADLQVQAEIKSFEELVSRAVSKVSGKPLRAAIVFPHQAEIMQAVARATEAGLITPIMVGNREKMCQAGMADGSGREVIGAEFIDEAVAAASGLVLSKEADLIVRGTASAPEFVHLLFGEGGSLIPKGGVAGHVAFIKPERYRKVFALTDAAVNPEPDLKTKIALADLLVGACRRVGMERPRVAVLAAVEVVYPQMPATIEAAVLAKMGERGQIKGAYVDGPLSFDCAIDPEAAESKGIRTSAVAGQADAMIAPNMETAHGIYKAMALYGRAQLGGAIVGGRAPVAMPSTSDSTEAMFSSIAIACLLA